MNLRSLLVAIAIAGLVPVGCAKESASKADRSAEGVVDEVLLAYLSAARALHHEADLAEDEDDPRRAIAALDRLLARPKPRSAPEIEEVVADTRARLADLRSRVGEFDLASKDVDEGLRVATRVSYFRGHLFEVRGLVEERRAKALAQAGDGAGAARARELAMKAYEEAIAIQDQVIQRGTRADGGGR
jgi:hypothetical protein